MAKHTLAVGEVVTLKKGKATLDSGFDGAEVTITQLGTASELYWAKKSTGKETCIFLWEIEGYNVTDAQTDSDDDPDTVRDRVQAKSTEVSESLSTPAPKDKTIEVQVLALPIDVLDKDHQHLIFFDSTKISEHELYSSLVEMDGELADRVALIRSNGNVDKAVRAYSIPSKNFKITDKST